MVSATGVVTIDVDIARRLSIFQSYHNTNPKRAPISTATVPGVRREKLRVNSKKRDILVNAMDKGSVLRAADFPVQIAPSTPATTTEIPMAQLMEQIQETSKMAAAHAIDALVSSIGYNPAQSSERHGASFASARTNAGCACTTE